VVHGGIRLAAPRYPTLHIVEPGARQLFEQLHALRMLRAYGLERCTSRFA
jgi:hypothetical protein